MEHGYGERVEVRRKPVDDLRAAVAEQTPFFDTATEDFAVAMPRGGKGLPRGGWQIAHRLWGGG